MKRTGREDFVVVPVYNEAERICSVLHEIKKYAKTIVVIDDGSRDDTAKLAKKEKVIVLQHRVNLGKGAALKTGCDYAINNSATKIVVLDGDGQHEPKEIPRFLQALEQADIIFGCRKKPKTMPLVLKFGNKFINTTIGFLYGIYLRDTQCGYRAFTADTYRKVRWAAADYYMETEMIIKTGKHKLKYTELPIETIYADKYKGTTVLDGVLIVAKMIGGKLLWH